MLFCASLYIFRFFFYSFLKAYKLFVITVKEDAATINLIAEVDDSIKKEAEISASFFSFRIVLREELFLAQRQDHSFKVFIEDLGHGAVNGRKSTEDAFPSGQNRPCSGPAERVSSQQASRTEWSVTERRPEVHDWPSTFRST